MIYKIIHDINNLTSSDIDVYPLLTFRNVFNKRELLDRTKPFDVFFKANTEFKPLMPTYGDEFVDRDKFSKKGCHLADMMGWIESKPRGLFYPLSENFYNCIKNFNYPPSHFYPAEVLFNNKIYSYQVLQLTINYHYSLVDYNNTIFCEWDYRNQPTDSESIQVKNLKELKQVTQDKRWKQWGYEKIAVKPEFADLDIIEFYHFGTLISKRMKKTIEAANLTGVKVEKCPFDFEISNNI